MPIRLILVTLLTILLTACSSIDNKTKFEYNSLNDLYTGDIHSKSLETQYAIDFLGNSLDIIEISLKREYLDYEIFSMKSSSDKYYEVVLQIDVDNDILYIIDIREK